MADNQTILLVGATGNLGGLIARAILDKGARLRCLVRPGSQGKLAALAAAGAEIVEGDLAPGNEAALARATAGVYSVVSAVQGGPDVIIDGQLRLLRAAIAAGARRFIPSDYSYDHFNLADGDNPNSDFRRHFGLAAEREADGRIELVHILCGCFLDRGVLFGFLGAVDLAAGALQLWGDGDHPIDLTTYADTARFTAEAAVDPEPLPRRFNVAAESLTPAALAAAVSEATGRPVTLDRKGSLPELDGEIARRVAAEPQNLYSWLPLMYWRSMLDGKGKLGALVNARYPHIRPTTVREYVQRERL